MKPSKCWRFRAFQFPDPDGPPRSSTHFERVPGPFDLPKALRVTYFGEGSQSAGGILSPFILKLYVAGATPRSRLAIANLRRICEEDLNGAYELQIIDVLEQPELAESDKILATPTLIKQLPPPLRRVIGDLSDKQKVLLGLEVHTRIDEGDVPNDRMREQ